MKFPTQAGGCEGEVKAFSSDATPSANLQSCKLRSNHQKGIYTINQEEDQLSSTIFVSEHEVTFLVGSRVMTQKVIFSLVANLHDLPETKVQNPAFLSVLSKVYMESVL